MDNGFEIFYIFDFKWNGNLWYSFTINYNVCFFIMCFFVSIITFFLFLNIKIKQIRHSFNIYRTESLSKISTVNNILMI